MSISNFQLRHLPSHLTGRSQEDVLGNDEDDLSFVHLFKPFTTTENKILAKQTFELLLQCSNAANSFLILPF